MSRLLKIKERKSNGYAHTRPKKGTFDHDSGLAYKETVQNAGPMRAEWVWQSRGLEGEVQLYREPVGAPSLRNTAIRCVCANVASLTADSLETIPWSMVGADLWARIAKK